jgi:hypothetical protein
MMRFGAILFAATFSVQPLPQADGPLEPSVQNEVDHAIDMGERWLEKNFKKAACDADAINCVPPVRTGNAGEIRPARTGNAGASQLVATASPASNDLKAQLGLTNGQTRVEIALKLVSSQRGGGWWLVETNAAPTRLAVKILKGL